MPSIYETGHAKNLANFETLISYLTIYGSIYNPSNPAIQIASLQEKVTEVKAALQNLNLMQANFSRAVAARKVAFEPLNKLSTRIVNALKSTDASLPIIENAKSNHRKLQGQRATAKLTDEEKQALARDGKEINQISASQLSFDSKLETFDKQIKLLTAITAYRPNETELQIATLQNLYNELQQKNKDVIKETTFLSATRIHRDLVMYDPEKGMNAIASDAKNYAKSLSGSNSSHYKQISGLSFKKVDM